MIHEASEFLREATHGSPIWRILASVLLLICLVLLAIAYGVRPFSGFAWAEDVESKIKTTVDEAIAPVIAEQQNQKQVLEDIQKRQLRQEIRDLQKAILSAKSEQCAAWREQRNAGYWTEQLAKLRQDYIDLTGNLPDVPQDCQRI